MLILIVDDEKMQRDILRGFLEKQGYRTVTAGSGRKALQIFETAPVQLVLLDHRMDDMKGDVVLEKMRAVSPLVHAIMITAYGDVQTAVKVMRLATVEKEMLVQALEKHGWVQTKAAESLGISERVLRYKMKKSGIRKAGE